MTKPSRGRQPTRRREQVLHLLREVDEPLGIAQIAGRLGVHVNTVRFHLDTLISNGQVECTKAESGTPGRPPQLFQTARGMDPMGQRDYRLLAEVLAVSIAGEPDPSRRSAEAGRMWGRLHAAAVTDSNGGDSRGGDSRGGDSTDGNSKNTDARSADSNDAGTTDGGPSGIEGPAESVKRLMHLLSDFGFAPQPVTGGVRPQIGLRNCPFLELAVQRKDVVCRIHLGLMQGAMESWNSAVTVERLEPFIEPDLCMVHLSASATP